LDFLSRVANNPIQNFHLDTQQWLCYPAKIGELTVMVYFLLNLFELSFALSNLFEMASDEDLETYPRTP